MADLAIGFGISDITPPVGVELSGFGWYLERKSTGIIEPLYAKSMLWQWEDARGAFISCDLIAVSRKLVKDIRTKVSKECQIPFDNIIVSTTHTHSGPQTLEELIGWGEKDPDYLQRLPDLIADSSKSAKNEMSPARLEYGETPVSGISYNRENKDGVTDDCLKVLKIIFDTKTVGFLVNYSCHPVVMCEDTSLISGDFTGIAINKVSAKHQCTGIFIQGSSGDQNPVYCHLPQEEAVEKLHLLSDRFAGFIEKALDNTKPVVKEPVSAGRKIISLPQIILDRAAVLRTLIITDDFLKYQGSLPEEVERRLKFEKAVHEALWKRFDVPGDKRETEIQAVKFGDFIIATHPAELFFQFHKDLEESLKSYKTMISGYTNDFIGYVPTPDKYDVSQREYSYPAHFVPLMVGEFPFKQDVGGILINEMQQLIQSLT